MGKKKWIAALLAVVLCFTVCLGDMGTTRVQAAQSAQATLENDNIKLQLLNDYSEVQITDKRTGQVWSSSMNDPSYDMSKVNAKWKKKMASLFSVSVTNLARGFGSINTTDLVGSNYTAEEYQTADGIGVAYDIADVGIRIALEFSLTDDGIKIRIPKEKIEEYGETFSLAYVDIMMFFGAKADGQEGYFFYPDGPGAIMKFDDMAHNGEKSVTYDVYGDITKTEDLIGRFEDIDPTVLLPVFGGNYGEEGYVAYVTEGDESAQIKVTPSGSVIKANYMYPSFTYRRSFQDPRVTAKVVQTFDADMMNVDYEICYSILPEGEADYVGMAKEYRSYLVENGLMHDKISADDYTLSLDLFMGIKEDGLIFDTFRSVTTFDQAQEILQDLKASVNGEIEAALVGWTSGGYGSEPKYFPASSKLGGNGDLKKLAQYAKENGVELSLTANFLTVQEEIGGYSKNNDIVYMSNYQVMTNRRESVYVMSPNIASKNFAKFMDKAEKYPVSGIKLENIGRMMYYNYAERNPVSSSECKQLWKEMLSQVKQETGSVTAEGGNGYVLQYADKVTEIPTTDCGYQMTTESVPFWQIVAHGYVDYTGEALNLSSDATQLQLKWIEYGYLPYFEITADSAEKLIRTDYNNLFSSAYSAWKDEIIETYTMLEDALKGVRGSEIVSHEAVAEEVYCTGYENGTKIYVNYNDAAVTVDGVEVGARSYKVVGGN